MYSICIVYDRGESGDDRPRIIRRYIQTHPMYIEMVCTMTLKCRRTFVFYTHINTYLDV